MSNVAASSILNSKYLRPRDLLFAAINRLYGSTTSHSYSNRLSALHFPLISPPINTIMKWCRFPSWPQFSFFRASRLKRLMIVVARQIVGQLCRVPSARIMCRVNALSEQHIHFRSSIRHRKNLLFFLFRYKFRFDERLVIGHCLVADIWIPATSETATTTSSTIQDVKGQP